MRFDVRHLELLLAIDRAGSISGAARLLGVDQPHVTRQLRRIEDRLGYRVFERTGTGTRPTASGAGAVSRARTAVRAFREIDVAGAGARSDSLHVLSHELDPTPVAVTLRELRPDTAVTTAACPDTSSGRAELLAGSAAVLVTLRYPNEPWPAPGPLVETELVTDPPVVHLEPEHPLAVPGSEEVDLADLAGSDWITGGSTALEELLRHECRRLGGFTPRTAYRCTEGLLIRGLSTAGLGIAYGLRSARWAAGLVARPYRGASAARWMLLHRPDALSQRVAAAVAAAMREHHDHRSARAGPSSPP